MMFGDHLLGYDEQVYQVAFDNDWMLEGLRINSLIGKTDIDSLTLDYIILSNNQCIDLLTMRVVDLGGCPVARTYWPSFDGMLKDFPFDGWGV